jgi:hypothetical protein
LAVSTKLSQRTGFFFFRQPSYQTSFWSFDSPKPQLPSKMASGTSVRQMSSGESGEIKCFSDCNCRLVQWLET